MKGECLGRKESKLSSVSYLELFRQSHQVQINRLIVTQPNYFNLRIRRVATSQAYLFALFDRV